MLMFSLDFPITLFLEKILRFHNFHTLTLQPGFKFSLAMHIFGLHSPTRCWIIKFLFFLQSQFFMGFPIFYAIPLQAGCTFSLFMQILDFKICVYFFPFFYGVFILLNQVLGAHSLCRCLVYTLQSHIGFSFLIEKIIFILSLSKQVLWFFFKKEICFSKHITLSATEKKSFGSSLHFTIWRVEFHRFYKT